MELGLKWLVLPSPSLTLREDAADFCNPVPKLTMRKHMLLTPSGNSHISYLFMHLRERAQLYEENGSEKWKYSLDKYICWAAWIENKLVHVLLRKPFQSAVWNKLPNSKPPKTVFFYLFTTNVTLNISQFVYRQNQDQRCFHDIQLRTNNLLELASGWRLYKVD